MSSPDPIPVSPQESLLFTVADLFEGDGTGAMVARVRGQLEEAPLRVALSRLQRRHPKLRARVIQSAGRRCYDMCSDPPAIPFEIKDYETGPTPLMEEAYRALCWKMDVTIGPMARMLVLRNRAEGVCEVIFVAHHAIADGASALRIIDDLLDYYAEAERGGDLAPVVSLPLVTVARANTSARFMQKLSVLLSIAGQRIGKRRGRWITLPRPA
ncbi:MAG: condensation domain-containing protein [bacterium]